MENGYLRNSATEIRTKRFVKNISSSWVTIVLVIFVAQLNAVHIDFDDAETSWLKNVAVDILPVGDTQKLSMLKLTGLATADIEDGVRIKPTFSETVCAGNETDLQIINDVTSANSINRTTDLILSLAKFNFKRNTPAYLCIKTKFDHAFQHMGLKTKFPK